MTPPALDAVVGLHDLTAPDPWYVDRESAHRREQSPPRQRVRMRR